MEYMILFHNYSFPEVQVPFKCCRKLRRVSFCVTNPITYTRLSFNYYFTTYSVLVKVMPPVLVQLTFTTFWFLIKVLLLASDTGDGQLLLIITWSHNLFKTLNIQTYDKKQVVLHLHLSLNTTNVLSYRKNISSMCQWIRCNEVFDAWDNLWGNGASSLYLSLRGGKHSKKEAIRSKIVFQSVWRRQRSRPHLGSRGKGREENNP